MGDIKSGDDVRVKIIVDEDGTEVTIDGVAKSVRKVGDAAKDASEGVAKNTLSVEAMAKAMTIGSLAADAIEGALRGLKHTTIDYIMEATKLNARYQELGVVMKVVGNNSGYTSKQMDDVAKSMRTQGISAMEARNSTIQLTQAQIPLTEANKLARAAQDTAVIGMTNSSDALQRMIYGIKSGQTEVLKTLGLNVSFEQSYTKMAAQLGKNTSELTQHEKMLARTNATMEEAKKAEGAYEASMTTASKQLRSMTRYQEDLKVAIGETFSESYTMLIFGMSGAYKEMNHEAEALAKSNQLKEWGKTATDILAFVADMGMGVANALIKTGDELGYIAAQAVNLGKFDFATFKAASEMHEKTQNELKASSTQFRDAVAAQRAAAEQDKKDELTKQQRFNEMKLEIEANYTGKKRAEYIKQLAMQFGGDFAAPYKKPDGGDDPAETEAKKAKIANEIARERKKYADLAQMAIEADTDDAGRIAVKLAFDLQAMEVEHQASVAVRGKNTELDTMYQNERVAREAMANEQIQTLRDADIQSEANKIAALQQQLAMSSTDANSPEQQIGLKMAQDIERAEQEHAALVKKNGTTEQLESLHQERIKQIQTNGMAALNKITADKLKSEVSYANLMNNVRTGDYKNALSIGEAMTAGLAKEHRAMFNVNKAFALAKAAISLPSAVLESYNAAGGFPWGIVPAGLTLAHGLSQIAAINSAQFGGGASATPSSGGSAGAVPSSIGASTSIVPPTPPSSQTSAVSSKEVNIYVKGGLSVVDLQQFTRDAILPALNEAVGDGLTLNVRPI